MKKCFDSHRGRTGGKLHSVFAPSDLKFMMCAVMHILLKPTCCRELRTRVALYAGTDWISVNNQRQHKGDPSLWQNCRISVWKGLLILAVMLRQSCALKTLFIKTVLRLTTGYFQLIRWKLLEEFDEIQCMQIEKKWVKMADFLLDYSLKNFLLPVSSTMAVTEYWHVNVKGRDVKFDAVWPYRVNLRTSCFWAKINFYCPTSLMHRCMGHNISLHVKRAPFIVWNLTIKHSDKTMCLGANNIDAFVLSLDWMRFGSLISGGL